MDTTGFNQIGRYGTLSLLKRRTSAAAQGNELVTSFGIDANDLTFGSSSTCGVRLYYPDVDAVHCKIMFEDRKAFLVIYGSEGVYVDGSWVCPEPPSGALEQPQAIVPLSNDSEFEIHNKRFRFTYPPREARAAVMATPVPVGKRTLRLSMIHSAQVFSPRPSQDPRENLKVLQSPLKGIFGIKTPLRPGQTPMRPRAVSPLKYGISRPDSDEDSDDEKEPEEGKEDAVESSDESEDENENEDEEQIILVETNHPRVVEEERDLVILEHVTALNAPPPPPSPARALQRVKSMPQSQVQNPAAAPPQTPRRKSMSGTALHRAVLIRSAQRAVWRAEREREDEEEEMEVMGAVEVDDDEEEELSAEEDNDVEMRSVSSEEVSDPEMEEEEQDPKTVAEQKSLWRKSIERIIPWPFSGSSAGQEEAGEEDLEGAEEPEASQELQDEEEAEEEVDANDDQAHEDIQEEDEEQEEEAVGPLPPPPAQTPIRRVLGSFMTPQPQPQDAAAKRNNIFPQTVTRPSMAGDSGPGRLSLGGGEARRVMVQQPWKVKDLVVPPIATTAKGTPGPFASSSTIVSPMRRPAEALPVTPMRGAGMGGGATTTAAAAPFTAPRATPAVTEEERKAIQERRRSAVREFKEDGFWKDGAPGMSPAKSGMRGGGDRRSLSTSPVKMGSIGAGMGIALDRPSSPTKGRALGYAIAEEEGESSMISSPSMPYKEPKASILATVAAKQPSQSNSKSFDRGERDEDEEAENKEDTHILLERMRETVEDMKRRRSIVQTPRVGATPAAAAASGSVRPAFPPLVPGALNAFAPQPVPSSVALATPHRPSDDGMGAPFRIGSVKKIDFSHITPAATSMRRGKSPARPLEDMLAVASTSALQPEMETEVEIEQEKEDDEPFSLLRPAAREMRAPMPSTRNLQNTAEAARQQAVSIIEEPSKTDDASDDEIEVPKPRGRPRMPRTPQTFEVSAEEPAEVEPPAKSKPAKPIPKPRSRAAKSPAPEVVAESTTLAPPVRRGRSKTPQSVQVEADVEEPEQPKRSTSGKRTRRGTAEPEETLAPPVARRGRSKTPQPAQAEDDVEEEEQPPKRNAAGSRTTRRGTAEPEERVVAAPARRGRKPTVEPEEMEAPAPEAEPKESKTPAVKRGRKPKVVPTVAEDEEEGEEEAPVPVAAPAKRSRSRKPAATADTHKDTDSTQPVASGSKTKSSIPVKAAAKGRKKAVAEQEEDVEEDDEPAPLARGRGAKSNIAPPKPSTVTKTPATAATSKLAKPRGRPKTPATAPAATTSRTTSSSTVPTGKSEKENTPGAGSNSVASDEAEEQPVKVRVSRKTTAAATTAATGTAKPSRIATTKSATKSAATKSTSRTKAQVEDNEEQEDEAPTAIAKPRATRIMRARTKTG